MEDGGVVESVAVDTVGSVAADTAGTAGMAPLGEAPGILHVVGSLAVGSLVVGSLAVGSLVVGSLVVGSLLTGSLVVPGGAGHAGVGIPQNLDGILGGEDIAGTVEGSLPRGPLYHGLAVLPLSPVA